jgi:lysozyme
VRPIPDIAVTFIGQHEGVRLKAYQDSGGVWTVGYGSTTGVTSTTVISLGQAQMRLRADLQTAAQRIYAIIGPIADDLTENQYAALLSFVFNVGANPAWTIWKLLKARQFDQIPGELIKFVNAKGVKIQGLVNRRADEVKLWSTDEPGSVPDTPPSSETRAADTPPTPAPPAEPPKPLHKQTPFMTKVGAAVFGAGGLAAQFAPTVKGWADALKDYVDSPVIQHIATFLITTSGLLLIVSLVASVLKQRAEKQP